tara:strand:+ start:286 stop:1143 length:858 start_codon:yes stop_codon:yes gene_type:complete
MENRQLILDKLDEGRKLPLKNILFAIPNESSPAGSSYSPLSRLLIILNGMKYATLPLPEGNKRRKLERGDIIYCLPCTWENHDWSGSYEMLCVVPRNDFLRVSYYVNDSPDTIIKPEADFHHTGLPYSEAMRNVVKALNAAVEIKDREVIHALAKSLLGMAKHECSRNPNPSSGRPELLYNRIRNWTANSFQEEISRELAAKVFSISCGYVSQLFNTYSSCSFQDFLTQCRLDHAKKLLEGTDLTVYEVADRSGFSNCVHFVRRFREINGVSPGKYRDAANSSKP